MKVSRTKSGMIGDWVWPVSKPAFLKASCAWRVTFQRFSRRSGSLIMMSRAAVAAATAAGVIEALKIRVRELCLR